MKIRIFLLWALVALVVSCERASAETPATNDAGTNQAEAKTTGESSRTTQAAKTRAFERGPHIDKMPKMRRGDWLHQHHEPGQSFEKFEATGWRQRVVESRQTIYLQPIGKFDSRHAPKLDELEKFTAAFFQLPVKVNPPIALDSDKYRSREGRGFGRQYRTDDVLDHLAKNVPPDAYCVLAITMADVYPGPKWNFVFGQASLAERVGVFSFARHVPDDATDEADLNPAQLELMRLRNYKILSHEIGHMFGIEHCTAYHCGMNGSNSLDETDRAPLHWCHVCLRKLHHEVGFDPAGRYEAIARLLAPLSESQAKWFRDRAAWVRGAR